MEVIFIVGATMAFFLVFLVLNKKNKSTGDYVLAVWLTVFGLYYIFLYLVSISIETHRIIEIMGFNTPLIIGPLLFLYVLLMVKKDNRFKPVYWLHGLPFLLYSLFLILYPYLYDGAEETGSYVITYNSAESFKTSFFLAVNTVYIVWSFFLLRRHKQKISNDFSYTEQIDLFWLRIVVVGFGAFWGIVLILHLFDKFPIIAISPLGYLIYTVLTLYILVLGFFGIKQRAIYDNVEITDSTHDLGLPTESTEDKRYQHSSLKEPEAKKYLEMLLAYFQNEKPYLNGNLRLTDVAENINISKKNLSQVINEYIGKNFFDFVNEYRINEVKYKLLNSKDKKYTLLAIAYDSGFNSKSSFNSIFKKYTGLTPSQYIKQESL